MEEIWLPLKDYEKEYEISNLGRIKSPRGLRKQQINSCGYLKLELSKNNILKTHLIHRLVASTFLSNPNNYETVNHKDGNKQNNNVTNLEWMSLLNNVRHSYETLGRKKPILTADVIQKGIIKSAKVRQKKIQMLTLDNKPIKTFNSIKEAVAYLKLNGFPKACITSISKTCKGKQKKTYNHRWKYL